jgi:hypothetical protein
MMYNDKEDVAVIGMQMSEAEGCETRISDWINHGIPMVISNRGGMPLQVIKDKSGIVLDFDKPGFDFERGVEEVSRLIVDRDAYKQARQNTFEAARTHNKREYTTTANVTRFARAFTRALRGERPDKVWRIQEMLEVDSAGTKRDAAASHLAGLNLAEAA